ncbi:splicing regulatory glutamine/lysine-rich protein 1-like [Mercenaria mercenaria]|uniref:splicing regulatory glutamine/lysine-rich protein 1-like n=1 Tax=Mercenaria mercenaria TaxID=6596 RepID=UPI00234EE591|nr:splicing regulatory glutamine/lysine-rich protein 1-like [Mercenaria mercenaria]
MGMTNAERQRKFRLARDADPQRRQAYLNKCKKKYKDDIAVGKKKLVKDMTEREHRREKKKNGGKDKKKLRKRQKDAHEMTKSLETPPQSPSSDTNASSRQKKQADRRKKKEVAKCYRINKTLELEIKHLQKKAEMYKKRWQREKIKARGHTEDSPRTMTKTLLRNFPVGKKKVKKALFQFHVLVEQLKKNMQSKRRLRSSGSQEISQVPC